MQGLQGSGYSQNGSQVAQLLQQQQQQNALAALGPTQQAALLRKVATPARPLHTPPPLSSPPACFLPSRPFQLHHGAKQPV